MIAGNSSEEKQLLNEASCGLVGSNEKPITVLCISELLFVLSFSFGFYFIVSHSSIDVVSKLILNYQVMKNKMQNRSNNGNLRLLLLHGPRLAST